MPYTGGRGKGRPDGQVIRQIDTFIIGHWLYDRVLSLQLVRV